ncbi:hypothetical protein Agub_g13376 [Astrephomene gubernaculifera]|uniref:Polycystin cation channel PKD1/PKD2 domain-containing protein n=1 Tax=Astrephomene gubernaculifera TaxID=47775 RepID=A0AAD3E1R8_9CHLO|nr:hypothetical protein Agub_g13376 [Astrephomene gubernaculifera]
MTDSAVVTVGLPINTSQATPPGVPAVVLYGCADAAGNAATPVVRRVTVSDPCQEYGEATCSETGSCSVGGSCQARVISTLSFSSTATTKAADTSSSFADASTKTISSIVAITAAKVVRSPAVVDHTPPTIIVLDPSTTYKPGQGYSTEAGGIGRITFILVGSDFVDPGVRVVDDVDGDISASVARSHPTGSPLDTRVPRNESDPYVITYIATDSAGNRAVAFRRVYVVCPDGERVCSTFETSNGLPACSIGGGMCGPTPAHAISSSAAAVSNTPPVVTLLGKALVAMVADGGGGYGPCTQFSSTMDLCDPGVTATDVEDGNLGPQVRACGELYNIALSNGGSSRSSNSLAACRINTAVAREYQINYTVTDSAGATVWTARTVRVCPGSEVVCSDQSCSQDGICLGTDLPSSNLPSTIPVAFTAAKSPTLTLLSNDVVNGSVNLPRGRTYHLCAFGEAAIAEALCDPGVVATDRLGVNITDQVYACPPDACFLRGVACIGHELWKKGIEGCVNSNLPVGSQLEVNFVVFDPLAEVPRATATRYIAIASPCSNAAEVYCSNVNSCGSDPCDVRDQMRVITNSTTTVPQSPVLLLVDGGDPAAVEALATSLSVTSLTAPTAALNLFNGSGPLYDNQLNTILPYGKPAPYSLLPCSDVHSLVGCGALAVDATDGDISATVLVSPECPAVEPSDNSTSDRSASTDSCAKCSAWALSTGVCAPGVYALRYSVTNLDSKKASLLRVVTVEERVSLTFALNVSVPLSLSLAPPPPSPPPSNSTRGVSSIVSSTDTAADLKNAANASAVAFTVSLLRDSNLQRQLASAFLSTYRFNMLLVRRINVTTAAVLSANTNPVSSGPATAAAMSCNVHVRLTITIGIPLTSPLSFTATDGSRRRLQQNAAFHEAAVLGSLQPAPNLEGREVPPAVGAATLSCNMRHSEPETGHPDSTPEPAAQAPTATPNHKARHLHLAAKLPANAPVDGELFAVSEQVEIVGQLRMDAGSPSVRRNWPWAGNQDGGTGVSSRLLPSGTRSLLDFASSCEGAVAALLALFNATRASPSPSSLFYDFSSNGPLVITCDTPSIDSNLTSLAEATGVVSAMLDLALTVHGDEKTAGSTVSQIDSYDDILQSSAEKAIQELHDVAISAVANSTTKSNTLVRLLKNATTEDGSSAAAANNTSILLQTSTAEMDDLASYTLMTAQEVINSLGSRAPDLDSDDMEELQSCLGLRGSGRSMRISFSVAAGFSPPSPAPAAPPFQRRQRQLLVVSGGGATSSNRKTDYVAGYPLQKRLFADSSYIITGDELAVAAPRFVGQSGSTVVAGLFLYQRRIAAKGLLDLYGGCCSGGTFASGLAVSCNPIFNKTRAVTTSGATAQLRQDMLAGIGVDAAFITRSKLYSAELVSRPGDYYNVTQGSGDLNPHGVPYGFFQSAVPLPGVPADAYPLLIDTALGEQRLQKILLALKDGAYLDSELTESLTAQLVTYSPDRHVFGYWRAHFRWGAEGVIQGFMTVQGLPAVDWKLSLESGHALQVISDLLLVLLVVTYCTLTLQDLIASAREQRERARVAHLMVEAYMRNVDGFSHDSNNLTPQRPRITPSNKATSFLVRFHSSSSLSRGPSGQQNSSPTSPSRVLLEARDVPPLTDASSSLYSPLPDSPVISPGKGLSVAMPVGATAVATVGRGSIIGSPTARSPCDNSESGNGRSRWRARVCSGERHAYEAAQGDRSREGPICESTLPGETSTPSSLMALDNPAGILNGADPPVATMSQFRGIPLELRRARSSAMGAQHHNTSTTGSGPTMLSSPSAVSNSAVSMKLRSGASESNRTVLEADDRRLEAPVSTHKKPLVTLTADGEEEVHVQNKDGGELVVRKYEARITTFWVAFEIALCSIMMACLVTLFVYSIKTASRAPIESRYDVYDAPKFAQTRFFMLRRNNATSTVTNSTTDPSSATPGPGDAFRWAVPEDPSGLQQVAGMHDGINAMRELWALYNTLQGIVMVLLIMRWVHHLSFQPHLSVIAGTLARMLPDLATFVVTMIIVLVMFASLLQLMWGNASQELSTISDALIWAFSYSINGAGSDTLNAVVMNPVNQANAVYIALGWTVCICGPLLFYFTLINFILALLFFPFAHLKAAVKYEPWVWEQLRRLFVWYWQCLIRKAPGNKDMVNLVAQMLRREVLSSSRAIFSHLRISQRAKQKPLADPYDDVGAKTPGRDLGPGKHFSRAARIKVNGEDVSALQLEAMLQALSSRHRQDPGHPKDTSSQQRAKSFSSLLVSPFTTSFAASASSPSPSSRNSFLVAMVAAQLLQRLGKAPTHDDADRITPHDGEVEQAGTPDKTVSETDVKLYATPLVVKVRPGPVAEGFGASPEEFNAQEQEVHLPASRRVSKAVSFAAKGNDIMASATMWSTRFAEGDVLLPGSATPSPAVLDPTSDGLMPVVTARITMKPEPGDQGEGNVSGDGEAWKCGVGGSPLLAAAGHAADGSARPHAAARLGASLSGQTPVPLARRASQGTLTSNFERLLQQTPPRGRLLMHSGVGGHVPPSQQASLQPAVYNRVSAWSCGGAADSETDHTAARVQRLLRKVGSRSSSVVFPQRGLQAPLEGQAVNSVEADLAGGRELETVTTAPPLGDGPSGQLGQLDTCGAAWINSVEPVMDQEGQAKHPEQQQEKQQQQQPQRPLWQQFLQEKPSGDFVAPFVPPQRRWGALLVAAASSAAASVNPSTSSPSRLSVVSTAVPPMSALNTDSAGRQQPGGTGRSVTPLEDTNGVAYSERLESFSAPEDQAIAQGSKPLQQVSMIHQMRPPAVPWVGDSDTFRRVAAAAAAVGMVSIVLSAVQALLQQYESLRVEQASLQEEQQQLADSIEHLLRLVLLRRIRRWRLSRLRNLSCK